MEKDIAIGSVGKLTLSFSGGKATISEEASIENGALSESVVLTGDAGALIDQLEAIVAKELPSTAALDPAIFAVIKSAVVAIA